MAELYNEGLFRKGLVRTSGLVRPDLLLTFDDIFSPYAIDRLEAALALDFNNNVYRTGNKYTTFADAFTGTSPKLTYSTAAGSNSTMVNSEGKIVWAPHNLALNSATPATQTIAVRSGAQYTVRVTGTGSMALSGAGTGTATDGSPATITASTTSLTITLTGSLDTVAVYRSDLGGMHPVPQSATGFEYYVPTNGNAEYLPRVGHHVYNGSTWVNEGLLIESEARTNLFSDSNSLSAQNLTPTPNSGPSPSGQGDAVLISNNAVGTNFHYYYSAISLVQSTQYTLSCYVKYQAGSGWVWLLGETSSDLFVYFNVDTGNIGVTTGADAASIEECGDNWYRISATFTKSSADKAEQVGLGLTTGDDVRNWDSTGSANQEQVLVYGFQIEAAPTPSSYMPTSGGTYTRTAQSLTVPPAQFGWPEPEYIGPELVANGDFSTYADTAAMKAAGWSSATSTGTGDISLVTGAMQLDSDGASNKARGAFAISTSVGRIYVVEYLATAQANAQHHFKVGSVENGNQNLQALNVPAGTHAETFVATSTTTYVTWEGFAAAGNETQIDNISVREINPLSVSIQMDGRMTYADTDTNGRHSGGEIAEVGYYSWNASSTEWISARLDTADTRTGSVVLRQSVGPVSPNDTYSPGINVPFNIASRHGSTFVNGAVDGVALTANTTPTALPDLSSTNIKIAYDFMGTIGTFRQFAGDIGDTGLVTATNPSTEPTLSLTFDGTNGSFYNLNWSE